MRERSSQSRRRRLLQSGLLQDASEALPAADPEAPEVDFLESGQQDAQHGQPVSAADDAAAIEQAMAAVLETEGTRWISPAMRLRIHSSLTAAETGAPLDESPLVRYPSVATLDHAGWGAIRALVRSEKAVTWVFTGDNVIQGAFSTLGARSAVEIFTERVRAEMRRIGDVVINTGIAGDTAAQLVASLKPRALRFQPDVVGVSLGVNDARLGPAGRDVFRRRVREILDRIRTNGAIPWVILPHPVCGAAADTRSDLPAYVEIVRHECLHDEVPCIDQWCDWHLHWPDPAQMRKRFADGRLQLNAASHQHLARLLFESLELPVKRSAPRTEISVSALHPDEITVTP